MSNSKDSIFQPKSSINCQGTLVDLSTPRVMGIINITPDSFYSNSRVNGETQLLKQVEKMLLEGATFIDIGAYSSRPGADDIPEKEEFNKIIKAVSTIKKEFSEALISIDTFRSSVAKAGISEGANLINDISAGELDKNMFKTIQELDCPYIMMHMKGTPQTMKNLNKYENLINDVTVYFKRKINQLKDLGIKDYIIDPGFGFAKDVGQNFELLKNLEILKQFETPILTGVSRKSMIYKTLNNTPKEALNGTSCLNTISLIKGSNILRVHDVKEAMECIILNQKVK